ncbi:23S rRNA (guanosine(2251)-2'-O)-methyltransferase RlmB [Myxococcota bacterium]|nr:23S rRNA (guanosine(2251)-2'-O)-methyltransferase RlmB [Myxococcota bacterium]MBU1535394.1 23S rRNA (guanosine(2251)-2'-O)-methyltransferase RlmB [Myxococcota bacterium]
MNKGQHQTGTGSGERVICGLNAVAEYLEKGEVTRIYTSVQLAHPVIREAKGRGIPLSNLKKSELDLYAGGENHQGIVAFVRGFPYVDFPDLFPLLESMEAPLILLLDRLQDPHNLGAIARSAYLLGATAICIPYKGSASVTQGAVKSSSGATGHIPIARVINMGRALDELKDRGFRIAGLLMDGPHVLSQSDLTGPLAIVVGSEDKGIRPTLEDRLDLRLSIPMAGAHIGSFNASVAASIVLYEVSRQRRP